MQHYRCKCGVSTAFGSMPPFPCSFCPKCKSDLSLHPDFHRDPKPHDFYPDKIKTDEGDKTLTKCRWCMRTKSEIEKESY